MLTRGTFKLLLLSIIALVVHSGGAQAATPPKNDVRKAFDIQGLQSRSRTPGSLGVDNYRISIQRTALGQEFLLQGNWIWQDMAPTFEGMRSKVVRFKVRGDQMIMEQVLTGIVASSDLPVTRLLASFPIVAQDANQVSFDWAKGFNAMFRSSDWYASDFYSFGSDLYEESVDVTNGFVEDASFDSDVLSIRHILQINQSFLWWNFHDTVEVRWYLQAYNTNDGFVPTETKGFDRVGFFEVNPIVHPDHETLYATKFDARQPITYAISANTPAEYREAIRDAVLYWNKAFGASVVAVEDAPEGVTAPDAHHNVIQWINWDDAGYAYADAQMDPRTGEILHAQVFLTSAFAFSGKKRAAILLDKFSQTNANEVHDAMRESFKALDFSHMDRNTMKLLKKSKAIKRPIFKGFDQSDLCFRDETPQLERALSTLLKSHVSEENVLKVSQDYVREVVAHEIGHTLGLRHNFAGSLAASFAPDARPALYHNYLTNGHPDAGVVPTSSVMDYQRFEESTMSGSLIKNDSNAFAYDTKAIQILYNGISVPNAEMPLFCTDSHVYLYNDCLPFDSGRSVFKWPLQEFNDRQDMVAHRLAQRIIMWSTAAAYRGHSIDEMFMHPLPMAWYITDPLWEQPMALFGMQWPLLQVERTFDQVTQWNWEDVKNASLAVSQADLQSIGGAAALFPAIKSGLNNRLFTELRRLLSDAEFTSAMSYGVKPFSFTTEQVNHIMDLVQMGYAQVSQNAIEDEIILTKLISVFGRYFDLPVNVDGIDRGLITTYLTAKDGQAFNGSVWVSRGWFGSQLVRVVLPKYSYDFSERLSAAKFLNGPQPALIDRLNRDIMQALQLTNVEDIDTLDLGALPTVVAEWVSNNKTIISQLSRPVRPDGNWWDGF